MQMQLDEGVAAGRARGALADDAALVEERLVERKLRAPAVVDVAEAAEGEVHVHGVAGEELLRDERDDLLQDVRRARLVHAAALRERGGRDPGVRRGLGQEEPPARLRDALELLRHDEDGRALLEDAAVVRVHARAHGEGTEAGEGDPALGLELREDEVAQAEPRVAAL